MGFFLLVNFCIRDFFMPLLLGKGKSGGGSSGENKRFKRAVVNLTSSDFHFAHDPVMCTHGCLTFAEFWFTSCLMLHPSHTHSHFYPLLSVTSGSLCCSCRSLFTPCIPNLLFGWLHSVGPSVPPHSQTHTLALFHIHMHVHYTHTGQLPASWSLLEADCYICPCLTSTLWPSSN